MEKITDLQELLKHELKDLYSAEVQLIDALPKMAEKASNPELKKAFTGHLKVTREHQKRLDKIQDYLNMERVKETKGFFANLFSSKEGEEHCKAMEGLIKEADSLMGEDMSPEVMDAALIAAAQKVEHYEISSYGTARAYATQLGFTKVVGFLSATLEEEYAADDSLTVLAVGKINLKAEETKDSSSSNKGTDTKKTNGNKPAAKSAPKKRAQNSGTQKTLVKKTAKQAPAKKTGRKSSRKKATAK
jgi:ferritin-like metal-binding protein YciE